MPPTSSDMLPMPASITVNMLVTVSADFRIVELLMTMNGGFSPYFRARTALIWSVACLTWATSTASAVSAATSSFPVIRRAWLIGRYTDMSAVLSRKIVLPCSFITPTTTKEIPFILTFSPTPLPPSNSFRASPPPSTATGRRALTSISLRVLPSAIVPPCVEERPSSVNVALTF